MSEFNKIPRVGVNGFGRIGRLVVRAAFENKSVQIVAINAASYDAEYLAYTLRYDSIHGKWSDEFDIKVVSPTVVSVNGQEINLIRTRDINEINWSQYNVDIVAECTGVFTTLEKCQPHLTNGAKKVVISAPAKDSAIPFFVYGVNHKSYQTNQDIISNSSCTTNCLAPLAFLINNHYGIEEGLMTTIHAVTSSQQLLDGSSKKDWRGGRCATRSIIPSSTGAAVALSKVIPELSGKLNGLSMRVPVENVSVVDLTVKLQKPIASIDEFVSIIEAIEKDKNHELHGIISVTKELNVSCDFNTNPHSCILDSKACLILNPNFVKFIAYYDNEWAYSVRMIDLMSYIFNQ